MTTEQAYGSTNQGEAWTQGGYPAYETDCSSSRETRVEISHGIGYSIWVEQEATEQLERLLALNLGPSDD